MDFTLALLEMRDLVSNATILPVSLSAMAVTSLVVFRRQLSTFRPFGPRESESIMNFSKNGTLRCICGAENAAMEFADRRQFCRSCGCEVVAQDVSQLDRQMTSAEIKAMTKSLRKAAIRASHLQLPPSITSIQELHLYLSNDEPKQPRVPPTRPTPIEQPQVH